RIGLKPPRIDGWALLNNTYYRSFDQYFNDSFSLRSLLIFTKRWLDYRLFHMTDADGVHLGIAGWLYSRQSIEDHRKEACSEEQDIKQLVLALHATERLIAATGRRFFFIVAPNKSSIYPEFVGSMPQSPSCNYNKYDLLLKEFKTNSLKNFVRLDHLLTNTKKNGVLLYDPTSRFWNAQGAMVSAGAIQQYIVKDPVKKTVGEIKLTSPVHSEDLKRQLMGLTTVAEDESFRHFRGSGKADLPYGIIYGDEFMQNQLAYIEQLFSRLDVIRVDSFPSRQHKENLQAYDIFLLERAESGLGTIQIEIDKIFSTFEGDAVLSHRHPIDLQNTVPGSNITLEQQPMGLQIKSLGHQSSFKLLSIPASSDHIFRVLKLTITSPHTDHMEIKAIGHLPYSARKMLKSGLTSLYLPLPFQRTISLDIHPGDKPGVLMLNSAEVIEFPDNFDVAESQQKTTILAQAGSEVNLSQSSTETSTLVPNSKNRDAEFHPKMALMTESELARLNRWSVKPTVPENTDLLGTNETKPSNSVSKTATDNSMTRADGTTDSIPTGESASTPVEVAALRSASINLNDFASGRIFQRKHRRADIVVSGTYTEQIEAIEARVVKDGSLEEIVPWTVIDASPRNGIFVGALKNVPQGGWYNLQVRSATNPEVSIHSKQKWGVGMLVACLGQSNMKEWFYTGTQLKSDPLLRKFTEKGWSQLGKQGNAAIAFGNKIIDRLGIPVGLLDYSKNGSGLRKEADWGTGYWEDTAPGSIYHRFISGVSETGGAIEFVIWIQGEADAARGTVTEQEYAVSLERFITHQVRMDITNSSDFEDLPFLVVMMIKRPGGKDKPHQAIRNAQKQVTETIANSYLAATTLDLKNHGKQHLTPKAYISLGQRVAQSTLHLLGKETYHRGPKVAEVAQIDNQTIEIRIQHNGGSDFTPASGITGWEVIAQGAPVPIARIYRHDSRTIRILLGRPLNEKAEIRYLYGAMPDVKHPVLDNSPMSLPLEEYQAKIN
ncbi:MAG: sialate O-acetylesterase, partial [Desulfobacterales bacterium]